MKRYVIILLLFVISTGMNSSVYAFSMFNTDSSVVYNSQNDHIFSRSSADYVNEYDRAGNIISTINVPSEITAYGGSLEGFDSNTQTLIFATSWNIINDSAWDVTLDGIVSYQYNFEQIVRVGSATPSGMVINSSGNRVYGGVGNSDPYSIIEMTASNIHNGAILHTDIISEYSIPEGIDAGGFYINPYSENFLLGSGGLGAIFEIDTSGDIVNSYDLRGIGFGPDYYQGSGYFMGSLAIANDGTMFIGANMTPGTHDSAIFELPYSEWSTFPIFTNYNKTPTPIPEPATVLLLGTGLVGLAFPRIRKKLKK